MPSCDVITHDRRREVELVGGRRRCVVNLDTCSCCPQWFSSSPPDSGADSAALYEYTYAQRTLAGSGASDTAADKRLRPSPRCLVRDHASLPPLLPPPPPSRDRHPGCADPPSTEALAWTRLGGVDHDVYVERCPHAAVHCPSSSARHLLVPATTTVGDVGGPAGSAVHYCTRGQLVTTDSQQLVPTSSSTVQELQLCRPVDGPQNCATVS